MPFNTTDQAITLPVGTDPADAPQAFLDQTTDLIPRLVKKYTNVANRTATALAPTENDLTGLAAENRFDVYDGANYVSLAARIDHFLARRTTDGVVGNGAVNNSTALVNDPSLGGAIDAAGTYMWEAWIVYDSSTVADIKFAFTTPATTALRWSGTGLATTATTSEGDVRIATISVSGTSSQFGGIGVAAPIICKIEGFMVATAAGTLQFQFAQQNLDATQTSIRNGSYLRAWRVS